MNDLQTNPKRGFTLGGSEDSPVGTSILFVMVGTAALLLAGKL